MKTFQKQYSDLVDRVTLTCVLWVCFQYECAGYLRYLLCCEEKFTLCNHLPLRQCLSISKVTKRQILSILNIQIIAQIIFVRLIFSAIKSLRFVYLN